MSTELGDQFVRAAARGDFDGLAALFADDFADDVVLFAATGRVTAPSNTSSRPVTVPGTAG